MNKAVKLALVAALVSLVSACSTQYKQDYTTKPVFCYQLSPSEQMPGKNCIGSGGHK